MARYRTLKGPVSIELPAIKNSRFIADATAVTTETAAMGFVESIRTRRADARHHCFAWRLSEGDGGWRASDAGEPRGTAGMPILARIDGQDLRGLVVVVTRWFGGTKLGKGGLIRAYGAAAAAVLETAEIIEERDTVRVEITLDYPDQGAVDGVLRSMRLGAESTEYGERIRLGVDVPEEEEGVLWVQLRDATSGRVKGPPA